MRADQVKVGNIVQFRHGNGVHTGTVKSVGCNGNDEYGSEVVLGDIYPHIYDQPTVTKHGGDLAVEQGRRFPQATNQRSLTRDEQQARDYNNRRTLPAEEEARGVGGEPNQDYPFRALTPAGVRDNEGVL